VIRKLWTRAVGLVWDRAPATLPQCNDPLFSSNVRVLVGKPWSVEARAAWLAKMRRSENETLLKV